jgi:hypothetical protein
MRYWFGLALVLMTPLLVRADGGTVRFSRQAGGYRITLFTFPTSLRAGVVDFSVLVQAADSGKPLLDVPVTIQVYPATDPQQRLGGPATTAAATNKLFHAIALELSEPGRWQVEVAVHAPGEPIRLQTELDIGPPIPAWSELSLWIGWPAVVIALFGIHQYLVTRSKNATRKIRLFCQKES